MINNDDVKNTAKGFIGDIEENMKRGILEMLILELLCNKDMYGYEMADIMNKASDGKLSIKEGSLYGPIYRLIDKKCISENRVLVGRRRTRIYFHLEPRGQEYLDQLKEVYLRMNEGVMKIIGGGENNE